MPDERVIELELGVCPEAAVSGAFLLQSERSAVLLFNATRPVAGRYEPAGTAVVTFDGLEESRFGGPNDEGRPEHPLYDKGMRDLGYAMCEVLPSLWAQERAARNETTARRIWGSAFEKAYRTQTFALRHFAFLFHDTTFECLAKDIRVVVSGEPASTLLAEYAKTMAQE